MTAMTQSYGTATEINIARFYLHIFEEFQAAPISNVAYVLGEVLSGITRARITSYNVCYTKLLRSSP